MKKLKIIAVILILAAGSLGLSSFDGKNRSFEITKNLEIFYDLFSKLNDYYVDEIDPGEVIKNGIDAMLNELDPYTVYIPRSKIEDFTFMTTGEYGGVGAIISALKNRVLVRQVYKGFPMDKAEIEPGDEILEINGRAVTDKSSEEISEIVKGTPNSTVEFLIKKPGQQKPVLKEVVRAKIHVPDIPYSGMLDEHTAYIKLNNFTRDASSSVKQAYQALNKKEDPKALVLDLRSNPGGLLEEAVNIMGLFVPRGTHIVSTRGRLKKWNQSFDTRTAPIDTTIKLGVLMNSNSASASEIVAGAVQDLDRGVVFGQRSFGKGLVQATVDVAYKGKLKITTAKYYIPSGRCIQALDYSNRGEDGSVGKVPDSLISQYSTDNGRKVYDGGGIRPDVEVKPENYARVTQSLVADDVIFDYITDFALGHDSIAGPRKFELSDEAYARFISFVKNEDFSYTTTSEKQLQKLIKTARKEKYYGKSEAIFQDLEKKLGHSLDKDLRVFQDELQEILRQRIIGRYYYQAGELEASLQKDPMIDSTLATLGNEKRYRQILNPN